MTTMMTTTMVMATTMSNILSFYRCGKTVGCKYLCINGRSVGISGQVRDTGHGIMIDGPL
jgi:hypothetical protein